MANQTKQPSVSTAMSKPLPKASDSEIAIVMTRMIANWPNFSVSPATVGVWKEEWRRISDRYGLSTLQEIVTEFIREPREFPPTPGMILERCHEKWPDGPPRSTRSDEPFQMPNDPVTQEQLDRFNSLVSDIAAGKVLAKRAPKSADLPEVVVKGMKAKVIDKKAQAAGSDK